jgi:hypothetical protein
MNVVLCHLFEPGIGLSELRASGYGKPQLDRVASLFSRQRVLQVDISNSAGFAITRLREICDRKRRVLRRKITPEGTRRNLTRRQNPPLAQTSDPQFRAIRRISRWRWISRKRHSYESRRRPELIEFGSPGRIRTSDQPVNSRLLYR